MLDVIEPNRRHTLCSTVVTVRNLAPSSAAAFKLKTNRPTRYVVVPTQGFLQPGASASITITLESSDIPMLLAQFASLDHENEETMPESDRFMVIGTPLSASEAATAKEDSATLDSLWRARVPEKCSAHKISVKMAFPEAKVVNVSGPRARLPIPPSERLDRSIDAVRQALADEASFCGHTEMLERTDEKQAAAIRSPATGDGAADSGAPSSAAPPPPTTTHTRFSSSSSSSSALPLNPLPSTPAGLAEEAQGLAESYHALLGRILSLTAERDRLQIRSGSLGESLVAYARHPLRAAARDAERDAKQRAALEAQKRQAGGMHGEEDEGESEEVSSLTTGDSDDGGRAAPTVAENIIGSDSKSGAGGGDFTEEVAHEKGVSDGGFNAPQVLVVLLVSFFVGRLFPLHEQIG